MREPPAALSLEGCLLRLPSERLYALVLHVRAMLTRCIEAGSGTDLVIGSVAGDAAFSADGGVDGGVALDDTEVNESMLDCVRVANGGTLDCVSVANGGVTFDNSGAEADGV